jgi:hypothetical protein
MMRPLVLSLVVLLAGSAAYAQDQLRGVYGPPSSNLGKLGGVYGSPQSVAPAPLPSLPSTITPPDYGTVGGAPEVTVPGDPQQGQALPNGVTPTPIPGRPGYGSALVNGHHAIIDESTNRIFQLED